jgi:hypothetical protein
MNRILHTVMIISFAFTSYAAAPKYTGEKPGCLAALHLAWNNCMKRLCTQSTQNQITPISSNEERTVSDFARAPWEHRPQPPVTHLDQHSATSGPYYTNTSPNGLPYLTAHTAYLPSFLRHTNISPNGLESIRYMYPVIPDHDN